MQIWKGHAPNLSFSGASMYRWDDLSQETLIDEHKIQIADSLMYRGSTDTAAKLEK